MRILKKHKENRYTYDENISLTFQTGTQAGQQTSTGNPMSSPSADPRRRPSYDILQTGDEAILDQLQTLMVMTRQNQEAIQHILGILAKQGKYEKPAEGLEMDLGRQNHEYENQGVPTSAAKGKEVPRRGRSQSRGS